MKLGALVWPQYTDWQSLRDTGELVDRLGYDSQTRHPPIVRAIPPTIGPTAAAEPTTAPRLPNARPRRTAGTTARRRPAPFGKTSAPGTACPIAFSPNGTRLLTTGLVDGRAKLWNAATCALAGSYAHLRDVGAAFIGGSGLAPQVSATSPDGSLGAEVEKSDSTLKLRDSATGDVLATLGNHAQSATFDSLGKRIAVGKADGTVQVWGITPLKLMRSFEAHKGLVEGVGFSPDGTLLATAGEDTTAKVWDLRTGRNVLTFTGHTRFLTSIAFSPNGTRLVTGSRDGTVRVYVLPVDELMTVARSRLTRGWTKDECERYLPGGRCPRKPINPGKKVP